MKKLINKKINTKTNNLRPRKELIDALQESETIFKELKDDKRKGYNNMTDLINSLEEE